MDSAAVVRGRASSGLYVGSVTVSDVRRVGGREGVDDALSSMDERDEVDEVV